MPIRDLLCTYLVDTPCTVLTYHAGEPDSPAVNRAHPLRHTHPNSPHARSATEPGTAPPRSLLTRATLPSFASPPSFGFYSLFSLASPTLSSLSPIILLLPLPLFLLLLPSLPPCPPPHIARQVSPTDCAFETELDLARAASDAPRSLRVPAVGSILSRPHLLSSLSQPQPPSSPSSPSSLSAIHFPRATVGTVQRDDLKGCDKKERPRCFVESRVL